MITVSSPSMVLNDSRAAVSYRMDVTKTVQNNTSIQSMVDMVLRAAQNAPGGTLANLVFTAHGSPAFFQLGVGLSSSTMAPFAAIKGKVHKIWFRGCLVARITGPQTATHGDGAALRQMGLNNGDGHVFIASFARLTGCYVVAPTEMQASNRLTYPAGQMDSYEGLVLSYDPQGNISWQHRYPSLYGYNISAGTASVPNRE
ncbi:MAG: hypothetical protein AAGF11_53230 [Myxococcota bacterium]